MYRIVFLSLAAAVVFLGFAMPFAIPGMVGWIACALFILLGAFLIWAFEKKTRLSLDNDSRFNKVMKADCENIIERRTEE